HHDLVPSRRQFTADLAGGIAGAAAQRRILVIKRENPHAPAPAPARPCAPCPASYSGCATTTGPLPIRPAGTTPQTPRAGDKRRWGPPYGRRQHGGCAGSRTAPASSDSP